MALTTYALLKTGVAKWLDRTDLTDRIPEFIALAEARFNRLPAVAFDRLDTIDLSTPNVTLPADCREVLSLYYDDATRRGPIEIRSPEQLHPYRYGPTVAGVPVSVAIYANGSGMLVQPGPDQTYTVWINYITKLVPLSDAAPTNWLLTDHPDLYLYGSLCAAEPYLKDEERLPMWKAEVNQGLAELEALVERRRFSANTPIQRQRLAIG